MRLTKSLLSVISALALVTAPAFAGEQFSLIEPGTEQELMGSYEVTSEGDVIASEGFSEPMNESDVLALEEGEGEVIYYSEAIVLAPSVDTEETPQG